MLATLRMTLHRYMATLRMTLHRYIGMYVTLYNTFTGTYIGINQVYIPLYTCVYAYITLYIYVYIEELLNSTINRKLAHTLSNYTPLPRSQLDLCSVKRIVITRKTDVRNKKGGWRKQKNNGMKARRLFLLYLFLSLYSPSNMRVSTACVKNMRVSAACFIWEYVLLVSLDILRFISSGVFLLQVLPARVH